MANQDNLVEVLQTKGTKCIDRSSICSSSRGWGRSFISVWCWRCFYNKILSW